MNKHFLTAALSALLATVPFHAAAETPADTLSKVKTLGAMAVGVRNASGVLSYKVGDDKYGGYQVEICQHIITNIEKTLGRTFAINYIVVDSQNRIEMLQNGTIDMECGSTTNTLARQKDVAFSLTTYVEEVRLAVHADSGISSIKSLAGKTVATTRGTTSVQTLRKLGRANGISFEELFGNDHVDSFLLLESGRADAFVMDGQILAGNIANSKKPSDFKIVGEALSVEPIAIMLRKNDPAMKKLVDDTIRELQKSGELEKIYDKWFMQPIAPKNSRIDLPATEATKAAWAHLNDKPMEDYARK